MRRTLIGIGWVTALCAAAPASALEEPLWEAGMGVAVSSIPDYRGADEGHTYVLPIPYVVYRGDRLKVDRGGVHGDLARMDSVVLDVSLNLGPPAKSDENSARTSMPDIDPIIEAGPSLKWRWYENEKRDQKLALYLPLRAVMTTGFDYIGWVFSPHLNMDIQDLGPGGGWNFGAALGPLYASEKYHDYYYEVASEFATATRPAYDARGGYSGMRLTLSLSKRFADFWIGAFARYDHLRGAAFEDSPLVRQNHSFMAGVGVSWIFARSQERVEVTSDGANP